MQNLKVDSVCDVLVSGCRRVVWVTREGRGVLLFRSSFADEMILMMLN